MTAISLIENTEFGQNFKMTVISLIENVNSITTIFIHAVYIIYNKLKIIQIAFIRPKAHHKDQR